MCDGCIVRHVDISTSASAMPGRTAHAISTARLAGDVSIPESVVRAGELMTERRIATWAIEQHATAIQKIASAR